MWVWAPKFITTLFRMTWTSWQWWRIGPREAAASVMVPWRLWWDTFTGSLLNPCVHPLNSCPQLHRRLLYDDVRGVAEPLNETSDVFPEGLVVRGRLLLFLDRPASAADVYRPLAQKVVLQPLLTFTDGDLQPNTELEVSKGEISSWTSCPSDLSTALQ